MTQILYRFFDQDNNLLYVGISNHFYARAGEHNRNSGWMRKASKATIEHYPDRPTVLEAERLAIINEHPLFNKKHNLENLGINKHFVDLSDGLYDDDFHLQLLENFDSALELTNQITNESPSQNARAWAMGVALRESNLESFDQCSICRFIMDSPDFKSLELGFWSRIKGAFRKGKK